MTDSIEQAFGPGRVTIVCDPMDLRHLIAEYAKVGFHVDEVRPARRCVVEFVKNALNVGARDGE